MTSRQLRLLRGALVSSSATLIAAVSHTLGGGMSPHPLLILALSALLTAPGAALVGIRRSRARVATAVILAQAAFHVVFATLGSPTALRAAAGGAHAHHGETSMPDAVAQVTASGTSMLSAHVLAALVTTLLVWHAEAIVRAITRWFRALLLRFTASAPRIHERPAALRSADLPPFDITVSAALSRRGPPPVLGG